MSALVYSNQAPKAEELAAQWVREALIENELPGPIAARFHAAREFMLGQGYNLHSYRVEERWHAPLAEAALYFAKRDVHVSRVSSILQSRFSSTDAGRAAFRTLGEMLVKEIDTLSEPRVEALVSLVWWGDSGLDRDDWKKVYASLRRRWDAEKKPDVKHRLGQSLARVLSRLGAEENLAFLRVQWKDAPEEYRTVYANELF